MTLYLWKDNLTQGGEGGGGADVTHILVLWAFLTSCFKFEIIGNKYSIKNVNPYPLLPNVH